MGWPERQQAASPAPMLNKVLGALTRRCAKIEEAKGALENLKQTELIMKNLARTHRVLSVCVCAHGKSKPSCCSAPCAQG